MFIIHIPKPEWVWPCGHGHRNLMLFRYPWLDTFHLAARRFNLGRSSGSFSLAFSSRLRNSDSCSLSVVMVWTLSLLWCIKRARNSQTRPTHIYLSCENRISGNHGWKIIHRKFNDFLHHHIKLSLLSRSTDLCVGVRCQALSLKMTKPMVTSKSIGSIMFHPKNPAKKNLLGHPQKNLETTPPRLRVKKPRSSSPLSFMFGSRLNSRTAFSGKNSKVLSKTVRFLGALMGKSLEITRAILLAPTFLGAEGRWKNVDSKWWTALTNGKYV